MSQGDLSGTGSPPSFNAAKTSKVLPEIKVRNYELCE